MEDEYLDAAYEDRTARPEDDYDDDYRDYDYEEEQDHLLAQQELEDFESFYGPFNEDCGYYDE